ncbi:L(+)-tartrate dehydratase subunit alpha [Marispirochaeta sp.]|jgi:L(+)-tartrate dehydratase alpha subunit|uniref:L(+)-tartrate dehydratase subunit alpha n=1 Tax=Marispirochaeta sp. TaxID=2038653 RepID=UPI0029C66145|nr:L(+)-tartrate dehydratase subunit alpha [Marispirochaeta sp.]
MFDKEKFTDIVSRFVTMSGKILPDDVEDKLKELSRNETGELAKVVYNCYFDNQELARKLSRPSCQDTGVINFYVNAGEKFPELGKVNECLKEAVSRSTADAPLRHNTVAIFDEKNDGTNVGERAPYIHWEIVPDSEKIEIKPYMSGGGCSLPGRAITLMPSAGYEAIVEYVFDTIVDWGINACPPLLVGIGIAGSVENAAVLSKKALLRPIDVRHPNPKGAQMEKDLEKGLNELGLGPQGISGQSSVMGVHIETAARHPSTISVAVNVGCWSHRWGDIIIDKDMNYEIISHKGAKL